MVLTDACILLLSMRFVGVSASDVPAYEVIGMFFLAYPLTLPPLMGLGIFDVVLLGAFMELGGAALEPELVAALTVWRAVTILGPMMLGGIVTLVWRRRLGVTVSDLEEQPLAPLGHDQEVVVELGGVAGTVEEVQHGPLGLAGRARAATTLDRGVGEVECVRRSARWCDRCGTR